MRVRLQFVVPVEVNGRQTEFKYIRTLIGIYPYSLELVSLNIMI